MRGLRCFYVDRFVGEPIPDSVVVEAPIHEVGVGEPMPLIFPDGVLLGEGVPFLREICKLCHEAYRTKA